MADRGFDIAEDAADYLLKLKFQPSQKERSNCQLLM